MLMTLVFTLLSKKIWCVCVCAVRKYLFSNMLHELLHMSYNNRLLTAHERASEKLGNNKSITEKTHLYRLQKYIREYWFSNTNQPESKEKKKKKKKKKQTPAFMSVSEWVFLDQPSSLPSSSTSFVVDDFGVQKSLGKGGEKPGFELHSHSKFSDGF
jgi:ABC-type siderophore export system fused ATPase/permease subunit